MSRSGEFKVINSAYGVSEEKPRVSGTNSISPGSVGNVVLGVLGIYFAVCIYFALLGASTAAAEGVYKSCGDKNNPFCICQANAAANQMTFFKAPFVIFTVGKRDIPEKACSYFK